MNLSPAQRRILRRAAGREHGNICPTSGIHACAQELVFRALERRGLIKYPIDFNGERIRGIPVISGCGRLIDMVACLGALDQ